MGVILVRITGIKGYLILQKDSSMPCVFEFSQISNYYFVVFFFSIIKGITGPGASEWIYVIGA